MIAQGQVFLLFRCNGLSFSALTCSQDEHKGDTPAISCTQTCSNLTHNAHTL